jgi:hypothetical protein
LALQRGQPPPQGQAGFFCNGEEARETNSAEGLVGSMLRLPSDLRMRLSFAMLMVTSRNFPRNKRSRT